MTSRVDWVSAYQTLTKQTLPNAATPSWPVSHDHCFQRIVLDHICGGVWYDHMARPAYVHMTKDQVRLAVALCHSILDGSVDLHALNAQSIAWRKASRPVAKPEQQLTRFPCPDAPT
ncbi:MAG: hypothetical protein AAF386_03525 [Pseudomonadota bacterium]